MKKKREDGIPVLQKIVRIMKFTTLLLLAGVLHLSAGAYAQNQRISVTVANGTFYDVITQIEKQSEFMFFYNSDEIDNDANISIKARNKLVTDVLNEVIKNREFSYKIDGKHIIITKTEQHKKQVVTGLVVDESGDPVIGASVVEKGTTNGITTDADGNFLLNVGENAVLQVSYIGYVTQEVPVRKQSHITITITEDTQMLDEVVVIGYGMMKRKNFTGSVSTINVSNSPVALSSRTNALDMLRGVVTGATISRELGAGSSPSIEVHGQRSIKSDNKNPLIVMDGVIYMGGWRDIDPSTIESLSVLKDATSLAAYGSQAANGVVMITTKRGKIGKPVISFDASVAFSNKTLMPEYLSPEDFVRKTNEALDATDGNPQSWMKPSAYENYLAGRTTDWIDYVIRTGVTQNYSASVSGASEKMNYFLSLSHTDQKGIIYGDDYSREALMARLENDITNWLQVGAQVNYTYNNYDGVTAGLQPYLSPYGQATRPNGELEKYVMEEGSFAINPYWSTDKGGVVDDYERYSTTALKGHILLKVPWIEGLTYRFNTTYSEEVYKKDKFTHEGYYVTEGSPTNEERYSEQAIAGYLSSANGTNQRRFNSYYVLDNILNYTSQFGSHFVDLTAVYTRDRYTSDTRTLNGSDFKSIGNTILGYNGLAFAGSQTVGISKTKKTNIGYLGRLNYNYDDRYHLSVSVRRDGSSVFGEDNKWGVFPAVGVAWTASREKFMGKVPVISYLKLKASWGKNGNQSLNSYGTLSTIRLGQTGDHPYLFGNTGSPSWAQYVYAIGNSELGWESTTKINAGFDIGLLEDRIHLELDAYKSKTTEQIFERVIPVMNNGFINTKATMGQVNNWGIEFTLNTTNVRTEHITWSSMLNFYLNRNKLVDLYGDKKDDIGSSLFIGKSLGAIYGYKVIGIIQEEDTEYIAANNAVAGNPKFANLDGSEDGKITADDRTILGYRKENFRMNMSHTFSYKDWELYALFTGVFGGGDYGVEANKEAFVTYAGFINNIDHTWWTPENRNNTYPRAKFDGTDYTPIQSYTFVRLQDLSLSYTFRQKFIKDSWINNLRLYVSAKNLFTITNWVGGDPEIRQKYPSLGGLKTAESYPLQRTFSFGLNMSF